MDGWISVGVGKRPGVGTHPTTINQHFTDSFYTHYTVLCVAMRSVELHATIRHSPIV